MRKTLTDDQIYEKFMQTVKVEGNNTKDFFVISFIGLTGSGKSTISKILSERLNITICHADEVRRFMNQYGVRGIAPNPRLQYKIGFARTDLFLSKKASHIIDTDMIKFYDSVKQRTEKAGGKFYLIRVVCPENIILERLKKIQDSPDKTGFCLSKSVPRHLPPRKKLHETIPMPKDMLHVIDTSLGLEPQIDEAINKLKKEGVI